MAMGDKMAENKVDIIPATNVGRLLESYPELETVLIQLSPAFKKLQNPVLRKTVAKIATLSQAAKIGKIPVEELVNKLRQEVGLDPISVEISEEVMSKEPPGWFKSAKIAKSLDSRPLLDAGEFPLTRVLAELKSVETGACYELIAPFLPSPLIDKVMQKGFLCWAKEEPAHEMFRVYFAKSK